MIKKTFSIEIPDSTDIMNVINSVLDSLKNSTEFKKVKGKYENFSNEVTRLSESMKIAEIKEAYKAKKIAIISGPDTDSFNSYKAKAKIESTSAEGPKQIIETEYFYGESEIDAITSLTNVIKI